MTLPKLSLNDMTVLRSFAFNVSLSIDVVLILLQIRTNLLVEVLFRCDG